MRELKSEARNSNVNALSTPAVTCVRTPGAAKRHAYGILQCLPRDFFDTIRPRQSSDLKNHNTDVRFLYLLPLRVILEEDKGPDHDVLAASGVRRGGRIDAGGMERPARDGAVGHRVIAFEH